ncbi:hypothetical protein [Tsukamurella soli]|uniref:Uncharacterized protein n=1 Tax=Tsukamurella soli TaxID=644556 RepID=A0ABP8J6A5_9ACTN
MSEQVENVVPVWTLTTTEVDMQVAVDESSMTPQRLTELRSALALFADAPIATLEVHPRPRDLDRSHGIPFGAMSPLARHLGTLISGAAKSTSSAATGEALYRMVVPAKVAAQIGSGVLSPMASSAVSGGVHSALVGAKGIAAQASFIPAVGVGAAGAATAGIGALTVAAPLMLMAVAAGASVYAEYQRKQAIDRLTTLLEKLHADRLDDERNRLDGCRNAIDKATAVLLDQGRIGASLGLDSAVHAIDTEIASAERRLAQWRRSLATLRGDTIELAALNRALPGIDAPDSEFYAHLELARLAIALKRRVLVLQAVEHAQLNEGNPFDNFVAALELDSQNLDKLVASLDSLLYRLSTVRIDRSHGVFDFTFGSGDVDKLLNTAHRLRALSDSVSPIEQPKDVAIEIAREADGSILVFPAIAAQATPMPGRRHVGADASIG